MPGIPNLAKTIILPERDEMLSRLTTVWDEPYIIEHFYPHILNSAGTVEDGMGVALILQEAINVFAPSRPPMFAHLLQRRVDKYLTALIDDEKVRVAALDYMTTFRAAGAVLYG